MGAFDDVVFDVLLDFGFACGDAVGALNDGAFAVLLDFGFVCGNSVGAFDVGSFFALDPVVPFCLDCGMFALACLGALRFLLPIISLTLFSSKLVPKA